VSTQVTERRSQRLLACRLPHNKTGSKTSKRASFTSRSMFQRRRIQFTLKSKWRPQSESQRPKKLKRRFGLSTSRRHSKTWQESSSGRRSSARLSITTRSSKTTQCSPIRSKLTPQQLQMKVRVERTHRTTRSSKLRRQGQAFRSQTTVTSYRRAHLFLLCESVNFCLAWTR